jgi:hypothetical protein
MSTLSILRYRHREIFRAFKGLDTMASSFWQHLRSQTYFMIMGVGGTFWVDTWTIDLRPLPILGHLAYEKHHGGRFYWHLLRRPLG